MHVHSVPVLLGCSVQLSDDGSGVVARNVTSTVVSCLTATTVLAVVLQLLITSTVIQAVDGGVPDLNKILC
jgi:hypothetical protein